MLLSRIIFGVTCCSALSMNARDWQPWSNLPACSAEVDGLISGIEINILAQQGERNASKALQVIESQNPVNMTAFAAGKAVLVNNVLFGMTIRRYNQLIAPAGNAALPGLAKVHSLEFFGVELTYPSTHLLKSPN